MSSSMKKILMAGFALFGIIVIIYMCTGDKNRNAESYTVAVIINDSDSDRWNMFREGLNQAATEFNVRISEYSVSGDKSDEEEMKLVSQMIDADMEGIIIECVNSETMSDYMAVTSEVIPTVLVENNVNGIIDGSYVHADDYDMGKAIASNIGENVGIVSGNMVRNSTAERLKGFKENISEGTTISWVLEDNKDLMYYMVKYPVETIVFLESTQAEGFVDILNNSSTLKKYPGIWVIGNSDKLVDAMDKGKILGLVVPNEFSMGYMAVESLVDIIANNSVVNRKIDYTVVTRDNMYEDDIQRIIFPIVQ